MVGDPDLTGETAANLGPVGEPPDDVVEDHAAELRKDRSPAATSQVEPPARWRAASRPPVMPRDNENPLL